MTRIYNSYSRHVKEERIFMILFLSKGFGEKRKPNSILVKETHIPFILVK